MGIYSRDYYREEQRPGPGGGAMGGRPRSAVMTLIVINVVVYLLQMSVGYREQLVVQWLSLDLAQLAQFQIWRLVTYGFCHSAASSSHIFMNMLVLFFFGRWIEPLYGAKEFSLFYLAGVVVSGLCHLIFPILGQPDVGVIGASGGVNAVVFLAAMRYPTATVLLFFIIPMQLRFLAVFWAVMDVMGLTRGGSSVAHAAHLGGAAFGLAYGHYKWQLSTLFQGGRMSRPARPKPSRIRIYKPEEPADLDQEVDRILAKISEQGEASLTDAERETMKAASRRASRRLNNQ